VTETVAWPSPAAHVGLPERLRHETAACHRAVEALADIAGTIGNPADYVKLLRRLHGLHAGLEQLLAAEVWAPGWASVGVHLAAYQRAHQLTVDLDALGETATTPAIALPSLPTFSHALGCLYVLEGSALGGRLVAGIIRAAIGDVPVSFLTGVGRPQTAPWTGLRRALRHFEDQGGDGDSVVSGARTTFAAFGVHLAGPAR
jgi:heme oxygenase